jgi:hypothetical protein
MDDDDDDEAEVAQGVFSGMETKEETPLIRGGSVKKPDSPEKPGMFFW